MGIFNSIYHIRIDKHPKIKTHRVALFWINTKEGEKIRRRILNDLESEKKLNYLKPKESINELMSKLSASEKVNAIITERLIANQRIENYNWRDSVNRIIHEIYEPLDVFLLILLFLCLLFASSGIISLFISFILITLLIFVFVLYKKDFFVLPLVKLGMPIPVFRNLPLTKPKLNDVIEYLDEVIGLYKSNDIDSVSNAPEFLLKFAYAYNLFLGSGYSLAHDMMKEGSTSRFKASTLKILLYEIETKLELIDELDNDKKRKEIIIEFLEDIREKLDAEDWLGLGEVSKRIKNYHDEKIGKQLESNKKLYTQYFDESLDIFEYENPEKKKVNRNKAIIIAFAIVTCNVYIWYYKIIQKELFLISFVIPIVLLCWWSISTKTIKLKESQKKQGKVILRMIGRYLPKF